MNVEGDGTFNSLFGLGLGFDRSDRGYVSELENYHSLVGKARQSTIISSAKNRVGKKRPVLAIIDEVSMVDTRMLNVVQDAAEKEGVELQWLCVGDPLQFLPVKGSLYFKDYAVSCDDEVLEGESLLKRLDFTIINLTQNIRAAGDTELVSALNEMRLGKKINSIFRHRFNASSSLSDSDKADMVHMYYNNNLVKMHNEAMTKKMISEGAKSKTYKATVRNFSGANGWHLKNAKVDDTTIFDPIAMEMTLCVGMPVMIRMNLKSPAGNLIAANGTMGKLKSLQENAVTVELKNGEVIRVDSCPLHAPTDKKGNPIGEFKQLPLHPAFAITMHKSQGITFDQPVMVHAYQMSNNGDIKPISRYAPNSLYVACSRVTKREWLHFSTDLNHLDIEVDKSSMWSMLKASYHTDKDALNWVKSITNH
jgi:ATP-dependent exoDNAse (exonuclease V) alpha subunit